MNEATTRLEATVREAVRKTVARVVETVEADAEGQAVRVLGALVQPRAGALLLQPPQSVLHHLGAQPLAVYDELLMRITNQGRGAAVYRRSTQ